MNSPEVLSFDLFDTLVVVRGFEPKQAFESSYNTLLQIIHITPKELPFETFYQAYREKIRYYLAQRETGRDFTNDILIQNMLADLNIHIDLQTAKAVANAYFEALLPVTVPFPKLKETLEYLAQDYRLIIISNHSWPSHGFQTLKKIGIYNLFVKVTFSGQIGWAKPYNRIWDHALHNLNVERDEVLHVGDNPIKDVDGAIKNGLMACWVKTRQHFKYVNNKTINLVPTLLKSKNYIGEITEIAELPSFLNKKFDL